MLMLYLHHISAKDLLYSKNYQKHTEMNKGELIWQSFCAISGSGVFYFKRLSHYKWLLENMLAVWNFNLGIFDDLRLSAHSAGSQSSDDATGKIAQHSAGKQKPCGIMLELFIKETNSLLP